MRVLLFEEIKMRLIAGIIIGTVVTKLGWKACAEAVIEFVKAVQGLIS